MNRIVLTLVAVGCCATLANANAICTDGDAVTGPFFSVVGDLYVAVGAMQSGQYQVADRSVNNSRQALGKFADAMRAIFRLRGGDQKIAETLKASVAAADGRREQFERQGFVLAGSRSLAVWSDVVESGRKGISELLSRCAQRVVELGDVMGTLESRSRARQPLSPDEIWLIVTKVETAILTATYSSLLVLP